MLKNAQKDFIQRHIGPSVDEQNVMLKELGYKSLDDLIKDTVPEKILLKDDLDIGDPNSEYKALRKLKKKKKKNEVYSSFIGMGYYGTYTPYVILRNILENPGWYTSYTPYQPEVAQGRLEMLLNFQQMIIDFTGMDIANASLLDEGTAAAEAMALSLREGVDADALYDVITHSAGNSWMFENRVPHILNGDYTPLSAVDIFVKDLGLVLDTARRSKFPLPLSATAHQMFMSASSAGHGGEDDSAGIKTFPGITLPPAR